VSRSRLYHFQLSVFYVLIRLVIRISGTRAAVVFRRIGVAIRYVLFPSLSDGLGGDAPFRTPGPAPVSSMPLWLQTEILSIAEHIDPGLTPFGRPQDLFRASSVAYTPHPGQLLRSMLELCRHDQYDVCFVADYEDFLSDSITISEVLRQYTTKRSSALVVVAHKHFHSHLDLAGVDYIPFGNLRPDIDYDTQVQVLTRFLIQSRVQILHIATSSFGEECLVRFGRQLSSCMSIHVHVKPVSHHPTEALYHAVRIAQQCSGVISGWFFSTNDWAERFTSATGLATRSTTTIGD
jgi:hypothetical protein